MRIEVTPQFVTIERTGHAPLVIPSDGTVQVQWDEQIMDATASLEGDGNFDGRVDHNDLALLKQNYFRRG